MANITQIKQHHVLASGTAGMRRGLQPPGSQVSSRHKSYLPSPIYTCQSRHRSILPVLHSLDSRLQSGFHFVPSSQYFRYSQLISELSLKDNLKPCVFSSIFLRSNTVLNLKFASHSQQKKKKIQLSRHNKK